MSHDAVTLVFYVDGRDAAEKVLATRAFTVPRIGDMVQLGPHGGPCEWRRVIDVTWRHEPGPQGGVTAALLLDATPSGQATRGGAATGGAGEGGRPKPPRKKADDDRQQRLLPDAEG